MSQRLPNTHINSHSLHQQEKDRIYVNDLSFLSEFKIIYYSITNKVGLKRYFSILPTFELREQSEERDEFLFCPVVMLLVQASPHFAFSRVFFKMLFQTSIWPLLASASSLAQNQAHSAAPALRMEVSLSLLKDFFSVTGKQALVKQVQRVWEGSIRLEAFYSTYFGKFVFYSPN